MMGRMRMRVRSMARARVRVMERWRRSGGGCK
jgi:hypothetical protein